MKVILYSRVKRYPSPLRRCSFGDTRTFPSRQLRMLMNAGLLTGCRLKYGPCCERCPVIRQHMTRHESTGTTPSLSAVRPNGPGYSLCLFYPIISHLFFPRSPRSAEVTSPRRLPRLRRPRGGRPAGGRALDWLPVTCVRMRGYDLTGCILYDRKQVS